MPAVSLECCKYPKKSCMGEGTACTGLDILDRWQSRARCNYGSPGVFAKKRLCVKTSMEPFLEGWWMKRGLGLVIDAIAENRDLIGSETMRRVVKCGIFMHAYYHTLN